MHSDIDSEAANIVADDNYFSDDIADDEMADTHLVGTHLVDIRPVDIHLVDIHLEASMVPNLDGLHVPILNRLQLVWNELRQYQA